MTPGEHAPDPREARSPAEFLVRLQALKDRSGLTYRELSARAEANGDVLPRSTVANMLSRPTLPREELLAVFVRACGLAPAEGEDWLTVRKELAARGTYEPDPEAEETPATPAWPGAENPDGKAGRDRPGPRIRRGLVAAVALGGLVLAGASVVAFLKNGHAGHPPRTPTAPAAGDVRIRVTGTEFCLGERRGTRTGQIHQLPCAAAGVPRYSLAELDGGRWRIVSDHPDFGPGCSGIPSGGRIPDAAYEDSECGDPTRVESFALEAYGTPVEGYRIVPVDSATPGSCVTVVGDRTAAWARLAQAPCAPDAAGQLFDFDRDD
ncbi:hypothetical protein [Streptomyces sp. NPDC002825]|uniref:hypothetical protein n=1 Tax=Streptomyces sp. NPDC002825 TaxID=3154666 RepID=UPI00331A5B94